MKDLSEYRNTLTHLGYASTLEWYKILIVLNKSLELMLEFYVDSLIESKKYFTERIINKISKTLDKSKKHIEGIWRASWELLLETVNHKIELYFDNSTVKINNIELDIEYGVYEKVDFTLVDKEINMVWQLIYSYLKEAIIIVDKNDFIVGFVSIDEWNLVYSHDDNGFPRELEEVCILVPKENLYFEREKIYDVGNKTKNSRFRLNPEEFHFLINVHTKKLKSNMLEI